MELTELDKLYLNNRERKSFQWQVWPYCNNLCDFCFLGKENREYIKERQLISLNALNDAIDKLDFNIYNNISLIGGEFFQGQLKDPETKTLFFSILEKIFKLYADKKIGSIWLTCTLTNKDQKDLYELLDMAQKIGLDPVEGYDSSGLWLCTSWDAKGRFHTPELKENWENNVLGIRAKYPWVKFNTTVILQKAFLEMYLNDEFKPEEFCKKFNTSIFYMQPCLKEITGMMVKNENNIPFYEGSFDDFWMKSKQEFNKKYEFFPTRALFIKFLTKYYKDDKQSFLKLFNIRYRSDEIHLNMNIEDHDRVISRIKDGTGPEESFPPIMKCGHVYTYAPYIDSNRCCICDRNAIMES